MHITLASTGVRRLRLWASWLWNRPADVPSILETEWRLILIRWLGIGLMIAALPIINLAPDRVLPAYGLLGVAAAYNLFIQSTFRRRPSLFVSGYFTTLCDGLLEITESSLMAEPARALETALALSRIGVRLAVDDFGTGYSSLAYLKRLPVEELKIDKSFVGAMATDDDDATIVRSIIGLAHDLGLTVVAEGVEGEASWNTLKALGCDVAQGYYMSRPVPAEELTDWLGARSGELVRVSLPA